MDYIVHEKEWVNKIEDAIRFYQHTAWDDNDYSWNRALDRAVTALYESEADAEKALRAKIAMEILEFHGDDNENEWPDCTCKELAERVRNPR